MAMFASPRCYETERDLTRMLTLLQAGRAAGIETYYPHVGDVKWWLYYPPLGSSWWPHIYLWDDSAGDRLLGWALLEPHGETFDVYYQPELHATETAAAMLAWAEEAAASRARAAGNYETGMFWVVPGDNFRIGWLEEHGYRATAHDAALARSLVEPIPEAGLPAGFVVRSCRGIEEVEARAWAQYGAFGSSARFEDYVLRFAALMRSPAYSPSADIVAAAPDGRIAAFCITWMDAVNRVGLFEPVGAHPDFQHKGLGKAVMLEALRRLREQGMQKVIVCTAHDNAPALSLYASVGFRPYSEFRFYARDLT
jgi:ribosomal protein S18 acetylase RimI-like enzyme